MTDLINLAVLAWQGLLILAALAALAVAVLAGAYVWVKITDALEDRRYRIRERDDWRRTTTLEGGLHPEDLEAELAPGRRRLAADVHRIPTAEELHKLHPEIGREDQ